MSRPRRVWPRRIAAIVVGFGGATMGLVGAALVFVTTAPGNRALLTILQTSAVQRGLLAEGQLEAGSLSTDLRGRIVLDDVVLRDGTGRAVLAADRIAVTYDGLGFLRSGASRLHVTRVDLVRPNVDLAVDADGRLDLSRMFPSDPNAPSTPFELPFAVDIDRIVVVGGRFAMAGGPQVAGLSLFGEVHGAGSRIEASNLAVQAVVTGPFALPAALRGAVAYTGDGLDLTAVDALVGQSRIGLDGQIGLGDAAVVSLGVDLAPLHLADIERFTGPIGLENDVTGHLDAVGPLAALAVHGRLDAVAPARGSAQIDGVVAATSPGVPWWATLRVQGLHVEDLVSTVPVEVALDGRLDAGGRGTAFPDDMVAQGRFVGEAQQVDTLALEHIDAPLRLERGVLRWTDAEARSRLGPLRVDGQLDLVSGDLATDIEGPIQLSGLVMFGLEGTDGGGRSHAHVSGNVFADDLPLDATATIAWAPLVYGDDVRFAHADGVVRWSMRDGVQRVDGDLVLTGGLVYGATIARVGLPDLGVDLPATGGMSLGGSAAVVAIGYGDDVSVETAHGAWSARVPAAGEPVFHADLVVGPAVGMGFLATGGAVSVDFDHGVVQGDLRLVDGERDVLVVAPTFEVASGRVSAPSLLISPTPRQIWRSDGPIGAIVGPGGVRDAHLALTSDLGRLVVWGDLDRDAPLLGHIEAEGLQLDTFAELFPAQASGFAGELNLVADVYGTADAPVFEATLDVKGLFVPGASRWLDVAGTFTGDAAGVAGRADVGVAGAPLGHASGRVPMHMSLDDPRLDLDGPLEVAIEIVPGPLSRIRDVYEGAPELPSGDVTAALVASGTLRDPVFESELQLSVAVPGWADRGELDLSLDRRGEALTIAGTVTEGGASRLKVAGGARTRVGDWVAYALGEGPQPDATDVGVLADTLAMRVETAGWPIGSILALQGYDPWLATGDVVGGFDITGTLVQPVLDGRLDVKDATIMEVPIDAVAVILKPGRGGYALDGTFGLDGQELRVEGRVPMTIDFTQDLAAWSEEDLDLAVRGALPLSVAHILDPHFRGRGQMTLAGRITGRPTDPWPDLDATVRDGAVGSDSLGVEFNRIQLDAHVDPKRLQITTLKMESERALNQSIRTETTSGRVEARLDLGLADWTPTTVDGWLALDRAWLASSPNLSARASGRIEAKRAGDGPVKVNGHVSVDEARYVYDADANLSRPMVLDSRITVHRPGTDLRAPSVAAAAATSIWSEIDVDVSVALARSVSVAGSLVVVDDYGAIGAGLSRADFDVRVDSRDLRFAMVRGALGLYGEVEIVDGALVVLGRPFEVGNSHLAFLGDPFEPQLRATATADVQGAGIDLEVTGTPSHPKLALSSDDLANDPSQILTALVTGKKPENLANGAGDAALSALLGLGFTNAVGALGSFGSVANLQADGTVHVVGRLGPTVRLEYVFDALPGTNQNQHAAHVEVTPLPHVLFEGVFGDEQQWADLYWEVRF